MLQEILLDVSSSSVPSAVKKPEVAATIIDELLSGFPKLGYVPRSAYDTTSETSQRLETDEIRERVLREVEKNLETALDLRKEYLFPSGPPGGAKNKAEAGGFIETFLSSLANEYENLRYPNTAAMPA
jgi:hypothetical protein